MISMWRNIKGGCWIKDKKILPGHLDPHEYKVMGMQPQVIGDLSYQGASCHPEPKLSSMGKSGTRSTSAALWRCVLVVSCLRETQLIYATLGKPIPTAFHNSTLIYRRGGFGPNGGIVNVGGLADCLIGIYTRKASDSILHKYDSIRRGKIYMVTDAISTVNFKRYFEPDSGTVTLVDGFLQDCEQAEKDPRLMKKLMNASDALRFDFTRFYDE